MKNNKKFLKISRFFTKEGIHPYDEVKWIKATAEIPGSNFKLENVEFPNFYSQNAINIIASKYFKINKGKQEKSLKELINRVVKKIKEWGIQQGYFNNKIANIFEEELTYILLHQLASFNSPVWFNLGIEGRNQQSAACFILDVEDNMESILDWIKTEGLIFKGGSGSGVNLSKLRAKNEPLSTGGYSSGVISFMKAADAVAGSIKSGGTTRRAAKMVILNIDHPEIMDFIRVKAEEENKIRAFIEAGYDMSDLNNPLWQNIFFQNANNSVRITDEFMKKVLKDEEWITYYRTTKDPAKIYRARELLWEIAKAAWECGDPGVQFHDIINKWNTCKNSGEIVASNPCSEVNWFNWTSCNLASINLIKFLKEDFSFDIEAFKHTVKIILIAQDILISPSFYPHPKITEETKKYRTIGLGYTNLGALIMALGLPYDSDNARALAASVTSLMTSYAYRVSSELAELLGPFPEFKKNKKSMIEVMKMHKEASLRVKKIKENEKILNEANKIWDEVIKKGEKYGFRNAQATVLAPTGTISFMLDADTTGIEPDFALVKQKQLVGGGFMRIVNKTVPIALKKLGYKNDEIKDIIKHLEETQNIETAPHLKQQHLPVFDCAINPPGGKRSISLDGHVKMVAAVQPFISGGISKTFNMPNSATIEDVYNAYINAWKLGIKCFSIYRDGSKATQALYTKQRIKKEERKKLPLVRKSETHKFEIAGYEGYLTYSMYEDGNLGEIFIIMSKQGSTLAGLLDAFSIAVSIALQYGVPLKELVSKFINMKFEPYGITNNPDIKFATSIIDYVARYLALRFLKEEDLEALGLKGISPEFQHLKTHPQLFGDKNIKSELLGPPCKYCGGITIRTGTCYTCIQCGESTGGCS